MFFSDEIQASKFDKLQKMEHFIYLQIYCVTASAIIDQDFYSEEAI